MFQDDIRERERDIEQEWNREREKEIGFKSVDFLGQSITEKFFSMKMDMKQMIWNSNSFQNFVMNIWMYLQSTPTFGKLPHLPHALPSLQEDHHVGPESYQ